MNDPDYVENTFYSYWYKCGDGFTVVYSFEVSWDNNIVAENPFNTGNTTRGQCRVSTFGAPNAYVNITTNAEITDLGADPYNTSNEIFKVKFTTSSPVPASVMENATAILRLSGHFASDCSDLSDVQLTYAVPDAPLTTPGASLPCTQNDRIHQTTTPLSNNKVNAYGYDPTGSCNSVSQYVENHRPSLQELQYRVDGGSWTATVNTSAPTGVGYYGSSFVSLADYAETAAIPSGTHTVQFRVRNWKYNASEPSLPVPTSSNACSNSVWREYAAFSVTI